MISSDPPKKFTVAIVGGGIGGLAFAVALAKADADVDVDIYESTASFGEVGVGLSMWPRVWDDMRLLGLEEQLIERASSFGGVGTGDKMIYRKADQKEAVVCGPSHTQLVSYHRAEFLRVLELNLPSHYRTHFGKRLVSYTDAAPDPVTLTFKDGTRAVCDVLVGADGLKSAVRRIMFERLAESTQDSDKVVEYRRCIEPTWSGAYAYRSLIPIKEFEAENLGHFSLMGPAYYLGKTKCAISYPINQGRTLNCGALVYRPELRGTKLKEPWVTQASQEEVISDFDGWDPHTVALLKAMKDVSRWAINTVEDLPTYVSGRVAILGDAAHAMTPHCASGAGQAIEDGLVLAALLAQPETQQRSISTALRVYDDVRRPFAQSIQDLSLRSGETVWLLSPRFKHVTAEESAQGALSASDLEQLHSDLMDTLRWTWTTTLRDDYDKALRMLRESLGDNVATHKV